MKQLILLIGLLALLIFACINSQAQTFITLNPMQGHFNPGLLGHFNMDHKIGLYGNVLYGDIKYKDDAGDFNITQFKYGAGFSLDISKYKDVKLLLGFSSSVFSNYTNTTITINLNNYIYNSVNLGIITSLPTKRRMDILFITDVNNWESQIGISIGLRKQNNKNKYGINYR